MFEIVEIVVTMFTFPFSFLFFFFLVESTHCIGTMGSQLGVDTGIARRVGAAYENMVALATWCGRHVHIWGAEAKLRDECCYTEDFSNAVSFKSVYNSLTKNHTFFENYRSTSYFANKEFCEIARTIGGFALLHAPQCHKKEVGKSPTMKK